MPLEVGLAGWLLATIGLAFALAYRLELRRRRRLVARACHELRGPLTAVRLAVEAMRRRGEAAEGRLSSLDLQLRRAALALDDFAAARSGRRLLDRAEPLELGDLLEEQVATWRAVAAAYGRELAVARADAVWVRGDRMRLAQAVGNLVGNALEHGEGPVTLEVRPVGGRVAVEVADRGPGLPQPIGPLVERARTGRGRRGHGLAIAAEIAARHGGRLAALPATAGARLALELPVLAAPEAPA